MPLMKAPLAVFQIVAALSEIFTVIIILFTNRYHSYSYQNVIPLLLYDLEN